MIILRVAPARERGLKLIFYLIVICMDNRRSREGAWIEMQMAQSMGMGGMVAPARERGLKFDLRTAAKDGLSRSREGAWIEIHL